MLDHQLQWDNSIYMVSLVSYVDDGNVYISAYRYNDSQQDNNKNEIILGGAQTGFNVAYNKH